MGKQEIKKDNFGYLDVDFQYKLAKTFIEDTKFFSDTYSIINQNAFTEPILRTFVGTLKDYYAKENVVPSYETISLALKSKAATQTELAEYTELINKLKKTSLEGYNLVKDTALRFFKQQNLIYVANQILKIAGNGDIDRYEECQKLLDEAMMAGESNEVGHTLYELLDKAVSSDYTVSIPTGIAKLDEYTGGGLDKGKIGLIIAPAGFGKTSLTTAICSYAATYKCEQNDYKGYKVMQIYFEDDDVDIARKHFSRMSKTEARDFKRFSQADKIQMHEWLNNHADKDMLNENLLLIHLSTGEKSASAIEVLIKKYINMGFKPDLVSIDYFECIASEKGGYQTDSEWSREGITMRRLENMAHDLNIALWVPTQGTKDSIVSPEVINMSQASGSAKKIHVAQMILSIARSITDQENNMATLAVLKCRNGRSGKVWRNIKFDNGTSTISCDEVMEFNNTLEYNAEEEKQAEAQRIDRVREIQARHPSGGTTANSDSPFSYNNPKNFPASTEFD